MFKLAAVAVVSLTSIAVPALAVPVDCGTLSTLQDYISQSADGGCFVQDKLFSNFSYTGGGSVGASNVGVSVVFSVLPSSDIHGFLFAPAGVPVWASGFTLGYTISVDPPNPLINITGAKLQTNLGVLPNAATAASTKSNGIVQSAAFGTETDIDIFAPVQSLDSSTVVTIPEGSFLISLEENYTQSIVPEPGTAVLFAGGVGLLLLSRLVSKLRPR